MHLLWWIIVGLIAGWATGKIMRGSGYGPLMDIVIGIVGAVVGGWIMRALGFSGQGVFTQPRPKPAFPSAPTSCRLSNT